MRDAELCGAVGATGCVPTVVCATTARGVQFEAVRCGAVSGSSVVVQTGGDKQGRRQFMAGLAGPRRARTVCRLLPAGWRAPAPCQLPGPCTPFGAGRRQRSRWRESARSARIEAPKGRARIPLYTLISFSLYKFKYQKIRCRGHPTSDVSNAQTSRRMHLTSGVLNSLEK